MGFSEGMLTFVTASWKVRSVMGCSVVFDIRLLSSSSVSLTLLTLNTVRIDELVTTSSSG